jgi:N-acetyl-gamma-glutamyl-phosphate reductase
MLRPYRVLDHQHVPEVEQNLRQAGAADLAIEFVPISAPLPRGILVACFLDVAADEPRERLEALLGETWADEPLVRVVRRRPPETTAVAGSMFAEVSLTVSRQAVAGRRSLVACAAIDNLVKGGAGQAIQAMNLMLGWDELAGLALPPLWP